MAPPAPVPGTASAASRSPPSGTLPSPPGARKRRALTRRNRTPFRTLSDGRRLREHGDSRSGPEGCPVSGITQPRPARWFRSWARRTSSAHPLQPSPSTWLLSRLYAGGDVGLAGGAARPGGHGGASSSRPPAAPRVHPSQWPGSGQGPLRPHTCQLVGVHARALVLSKAAACAQGC